MMRGQMPKASEEERREMQATGGLIGLNMVEAWAPVWGFGEDEVHGSSGGSAKRQGREVPGRVCFVMFGG